MKYLQFANGRITLATNCDMFVYMNGELVVDLGGVHGPQSATLNLGTVRLPLFHVLFPRAAGTLTQPYVQYRIPPAVAHVPAALCAVTTCNAAST